MLSVLTAGDKHFFRHVETLKRQTGVTLNLWGINPLEVTHFKSGFLGVPPDFAEERVYSHGAMKQLRYQSLRFGAMMKSPGYFNRSLWDTLSGEYYRSFTTKTDYFHVFDYWRWDEKLIEDTLDSEYDWERAPDTRTTWRIGDGTAAFYNYAYYTIAGFTEHDTFRSNQVREGDLTREEALRSRRGGEHAALPEPQVVSGCRRSRLQARDRGDQPDAQALRGRNAADARVSERLTPQPVDATAAKAPQAGRRRRARRSTTQWWDRPGIPTTTTPRRRRG